MKHGIVVTIDGPAGAGKSTVARRLARELGYEWLDTGSLSRTVALIARQRGIAWDDEPGLADICRSLEVEFRFDGDVNRVMAHGSDVSDDIRQPAISQGASQVSALPAVRAGLLDLQRRIGASGGVVVEGRDTGTVVFPRAQAKFFLTASDQVRARRRYDELTSAGADITFEETLTEQRTRDQRDSGRDVAPLARAPDAVLVDSSDMSVDQVVADIAAQVRTREAAHHEEP